MTGSLMVEVENMITLLTGAIPTPSGGRTTPFTCAAAGETLNPEKP
jgi:hypothetical protein